MLPRRFWLILLSLCLFWVSDVFSNDKEVSKELITEKPQPIEPRVGSWTFSGMVSDESGERYGYFFQIQREGIDFHTKTALIDSVANKLVFFYEGQERIENPTALNWQVGRSFIHYNPINDSWVFGVKTTENKGFNFKVDMLQQANEDKEVLVLRPGVEMQTLQTSRLNGHIHIEGDDKEQFVTGNNAWFGRLWFSKEQTRHHDISTTFCRLNDENGFYSANLKEADATGAAIARWRDASGKRVKMSQFISIKPLDNKAFLLSIGFPKMNLKVLNTLSLEVPAPEHKPPLLIAGFSKNNHEGFCFIAEQTFSEVKAAAVNAVSSIA